jgi:Leucine-rich repeat (LRR) protein
MIISPTDRYAGPVKCWRACEGYVGILKLFEVAVSSEEKIVRDTDIKKLKSWIIDVIEFEKNDMPILVRIVFVITYVFTAFIAPLFCYWKSGDFRNKYLKKDRENRLELRDLGLKEVPKEVEFFAKNTTSINLTDNNFEKIEKCFFEKFPKLTSLDLSRNKIPIEYGMMKGGENLKKLILNRKGLLDENKEDVEITGETFENLTNLEELDLRSNHIISIKKNAFKSSKLKKLKLNFNEIKVIENLEGLPQLEELDLKYNNLENIDFLINLTELKTLDLSNNKIRIIIAFESLKSLTNLEELDLSWNPIKVFTENALESLTKLKKLNFNIYIENTEDVKNISSKAFSKLKNLEELILPEILENVAEFKKENLNLPKNCKVIYEEF